MKYRVRVSLPNGEIINMMKVDDIKWDGDIVTFCGDYPAEKTTLGLAAVDKINIEVLNDEK